MKTVFNVIYRDLAYTTMYRSSARRTRQQATRLMESLKSRGWEVIIDDKQPANGAAINAPVVDVRKLLIQGGAA